MRALVAFVILAHAVDQAPIRRAPSFGVAVEAIHLNVTVTDAANRFVTGLAERDFAILEDGVIQEPSFFASSDVPLSVSILIDCSASMNDKLRFAQEAGVRFVRTLRSQDSAQILQFSDRITTLQDFTADQAALEAALRSTRAGGATALYTALYVTLKQLREQGSRSDPRRRAVVLLSDGEDTASPVTDDQVLELARRSDIAVYSISLRPERFREPDKAQGEAAYFLAVLTRDTGGEMFSAAAAGLDAVYARIAEELGSQYTLGYLPTNPHKDGKWRRIVVRARDDELRVRHKLGYYGPRS